MSLSVYQIKVRSSVSLGWNKYEYNDHVRVVVRCRNEDHSITPYVHARVTAYLHRSAGGVVCCHIISDHIIWICYGAPHP